MTHDLFKDVLDRLGAHLEQVIITDLHDGTFFAELEVRRDGTTTRVSARPSDALALAARYTDPVPIFAEEAVLDEAGVLFDQEAVEDPSGDEIEAIEQFREFLDQVTPEDFAHGAE